MSLQNNATLKTLNLRLNSIADQGGNALFICVSILRTWACGAKETSALPSTQQIFCFAFPLQLLRNRTLRRLNVSSNRMTNLVTPALRCGGRVTSVSNAVVHFIALIAALTATRLFLLFLPLQ
jgi:hypothetical protein